jgi:hypothetical protein
MGIEDHLKLLGWYVAEKATGFRGVVTSVSFDISGCVTGLVQPKMGEGKSEKAELPEPRWFDTKRLEGDAQALPMPSFAAPPGGQALPVPRDKPAR